MERNIIQSETNIEYSLLMSLMGVSVSKHLLDEHFTLLWANDFYYDLIGYPKEEYENLLDAYHPGTRKCPSDTHR